MALKKDLETAIANLKIIQIIQSFDKHIIRNLKDASIETRPANSNGLWCCLLLPTVLVLYALQYKVSLEYSIITCIAVALLAYCILFIVYMSISCLVLKENISGGCGAASLVSTLLLYAIFNQGLLYSLSISLVSVYLFSMLLRLSLTMYPKTFTIGEAMIVMQGITLYALLMFLRLTYRCGDKSDAERVFVNNINFTILSSVGIIVTALNMLDDTQRDLKTLSYIISVAGTYALVMLHLLIGVDCIVQVVVYIVLDMKKVQLFLFWFGLCILSFFVILLRTRVAVKATTVTRKVFHILASLVFLTGIAYDEHLIVLAAGFGLGLMILLEAIRKSKIEEISDALEAAFQVYCDEKDTGCFALTPIYLYVGLAAPLVLVPNHAHHKLELLAGVLSIGVGDTAASWFGSKYGVNKWADGQKSLEGTAFNIMSQIATVYALEFLDLIQEPNLLIRAIVAAVATGMLEAKTDQIDNLVLPLASLVSLRFAWFLFDP